MDNWQLTIDGAILIIDPFDFSPSARRSKKESFKNPKHFQDEAVRERERARVWFVFRDSVILFLLVEALFLFDFWLLSLFKQIETTQL